MRKPGGWMKPADDRLLEWLSERGNLSPVAISKDGEIERVPISEKYAGERLRELARYQMVCRIDRGLYGIDEKGRAYLDGELDADELERGTLEDALVDE